MRQLFIGFVLFFIVLLLFLPTSEEGPDLSHYLAWGHSVYYDGDLSLLNQFKLLKITDYYFTPTGFVGELRNFGLAFLWLPFYTLAARHTTATKLPLQILYLNWSTLLYMMLACGAMLSVLQRFYSTKVAWSAVILLCLGTPLAFYTFQHTLSAHPASVCLAALFLLLCLKKENTPWKYISSGILAGWLMALATYNVAVLLAPFATSIGEFIAQRQWRRFVFQNSLLTLGVCLGFLPQMLVWRLLYGSLLASPYSRQMQWSDPRLVEVLFSPLHGLLIYAPLLLLVPLGLFFLARQNKPLAIGIGLSWLMLTYLASVNLAWWAGASFGNRYFLVLSPFFALALGALLQQNYHWLWLMLACCCWTIGLWLEFTTGILKLVSASRYYPLPLLFAKQLPAWQSISSLSLFTTKHWLATTPTLVSGEILGLSIVGYFLSCYGLKWLRRWSSSQHAALLSMLSLLVIGYAALLAQRTIAQRTPASTADFADRRARIANYDPIDLSASYMERANYHFAMDQPALALRNAQLAGQTWPSPERQIVGYENLVAPPISHTLDLQAGPIHLIGYRWQAPHQLFLCWQKIKSDSKYNYSPRLQLKDAEGKWTGESQLNDPLPIRFIGRGYIACDDFVLPSQLPATQIWFAISFADEKSSAQDFYLVR